MYIKIHILVFVFGAAFNEDAKEAKSKSHKIMTTFKATDNKTCSLEMVRTLNKTKYRGNFERTSQQNCKSAKSSQFLNTNL